MRQCEYSTCATLDVDLGRETKRGLGGEEDGVPSQHILRHTLFPSQVAQKTKKMWSPNILFASPVPFLLLARSGGGSDGQGIKFSLKVDRQLSPMGVYLYV